MSERLGLFTTAIIAAFGWLVTHYVDRLTTAPTVEYQISTEQRDTRFRHRYVLTNINRTTAFGPLRLSLQARPGHPIIGHAFRAIEPTSEGEEPKTQSPNSAEYTVPTLLPRGGVAVDLETASNARPTLRVSSPTSVIRLVPTGTETWLVANELSILLFLILVWIGMLVIIFLFVVKGGSKAKEVQQGG